MNIHIFICICEGVFELVVKIRCTSIGQLNAMQEFHLWGCLNLQELNVHLNWPIECTLKIPLWSVQICKN